MLDAACGRPKSECWSQTTSPSRVRYLASSILESAKDPQRRGKHEHSINGVAGNGALDVIGAFGRTEPDHGSDIAGGLALSGSAADDAGDPALATDDAQPVANRRHRKSGKP